MSVLRSKHKPGVAILVTGMGRQNAATALRDFLTVCPAELVLTCGFAGGLDPALPPGAVVFATDDDELGENLLAAGAKRARFHCADRVAVTAMEKQQLRTATGADAVEMESEAVQTVCREHALPCATVRVISDSAGEDLPLDFNQLYRPDMTLDYVKLAWAVLQAPGKIGALMKLQQRCRFAATQLAGVLMKVVAQEEN